MREKISEMIRAGKTSLGIEFGSTRIKAVLVGEDHVPVASGSHEWENQLIGHIWTYSLEDIIQGMQDCYASLANEVEEHYGVPLETIGALGISGMMHGYMAFDRNDRLLVPFRTWRNTMTEEAAGKLTDLFAFPIPQRWSIAHLYQAICNGEEHVGEIAYLTTLAGYVHWRLTGQKAVGIGEASGMFPIDSRTRNYHQDMLRKFDCYIEEKGYPWKIEEILPQVLTAGEQGGVLTQEGAKLLDVSGRLRSGVKLCPPEGDAGTGMTATNSVAVRTGNISAGTSVFAMIVLEKELSRLHPELDLVTTPTGKPVAMVHCNNCTSDLNAWINLFGEFAALLGAEQDKDRLFELLYGKAMEAEADGGGMLACNYFSGEHITRLEEGRPFFVRRPDSALTLANFMRTHLFSALATLKLGLDILLQEEKVKVDKIYGHGGLFRTKGVGQSLVAAAMDTPVSLMDTAGEGGAWGIALLASYMNTREEGEALESFLQKKVFSHSREQRVEPRKQDVDGFNTFMERYRRGLAVERSAVEQL